MKKNNVRDYVISAFRYYARMGEPSETEIKNLKNISTAERLDLSAAAAMLEKLSAQGDVSSIAAVREIYFFEPDRKLRHNELSQRVIHYALNNYTSDRTVWRSLKRATNIFIELRNLRYEC